ncbi:MAG TPA: hydantoinase/oxoprolinase family protein [Ideonella sp.]|nr:hydantoinase/oxoprolinase family protein [Ideonella sp.]
MPSLLEQTVVGWDIGGAHVKACVLQRGEVVDVAQWACPLWQGMDHLERVLLAAGQRWPALAQMQHAVTMTGEMVDLFAHREEGVQRIAAALAEVLPAPAFFAGDAGWCGSGEVAQHWASVASANWLATAQHAALCLDQGVLLDIGSTTTDIVAFRGGRVLTASRSDAQRLATGELVYHGVVRTPLCALARRVPWRGTPLNVMNEFFATVADVYRLTGELDPAHDLYPPADGGAKDAPATHARLARMIGLDARDGEPADWLAFAQGWRAAQVAELGGQLQRVLAAHRLGSDAVVVSAGCGDFLAADVVAAAAAGGELAAPQAVRAYGLQVARLGAQAVAAQPDVAAWAQVCAPCVAVATLLDGERR